MTGNDLLEHLKILGPEVLKLEVRLDGSEYGRLKHVEVVKMKVKDIFEMEFLALTED